jgi:hypothetical protein
LKEKFDCGARSLGSGRSLIQGVIIPDCCQPIVAVHLEKLIPTMKKLLPKYLRLGQGNFISGVHLRDTKPTKTLDRSNRR